MFWNKGKTKTEASHAFGNYFQLNSHAITAGEMLRKLLKEKTLLLFYTFTPQLLGLRNAAEQELSWEI